MLNFIFTVLLFNLFFALMLLLIHRRIPITRPVLVMTAVVAFACVIFLPYLANHLDYPGLAAALAALILFCSLILTLVKEVLP